MCWMFQVSRFDCHQTDHRTILLWFPFWQKFFVRSETSLWQKCEGKRNPVHFRLSWTFPSIRLNLSPRAQRQLIVLIKCSVESIWVNNLDIFAQKHSVLSYALTQENKTGRESFLCWTVSLRSQLKSWKNARGAWYHPRRVIFGIISSYWTT